MLEKEYCIAQINIAQFKLPIDNPVNADFMDNQDRINSEAENYDGFVWRLKDDSGNATSIKLFENPNLIVNMSVWDTIHDLFNYTYKSNHIDIFRRKSEWFEKMERPHLVLWWIPKGIIPTPVEGKEKLKYTHSNGPTPLGFTFKEQFSIQEMLAFIEK